MNDGTWSAPPSSARLRDTCLTARCIKGAAARAAKVLTAGVLIGFAGAAIAAEPAYPAGRTDMMFTPISTALPFVKGGRLRALAVTSPQRVALMPELPTIAESGVPAYESRAWYGLVGPGRMDKALVTKLNGEIDRMLTSPEGRDKLQALGVIPMGGSAADFDSFIRREVEKYAKVVKAGGIRLE